MEFGVVFRHSRVSLALYSNTTRSAAWALPKAPFRWASRAAAVVKVWSAPNRRKATTSSSSVSFREDAALAWYGKAKASLSSTSSFFRRSFTGLGAFRRAEMRCSNPAVKSRMSLRVTSSIGIFVWNSVVFV